MKAGKHNQTNKSPKVSALKDNPLLASSANIAVTEGLFMKGHDITLLTGPLGTYPEHRRVLAPVGYLLKG